MATEFISTIGASGCNYTSPITWEDAMDAWGDLTSSAFITQATTGETGTYAGYLCTGQTTGYTGTVRVQRTGRLLATMTVAGNNWASGEQVQRNGANYFYASGSADSVIQVAEFSGDVSIAASLMLFGFTTSETNKIILRTIGAAQRSASDPLRDGYAAGRLIQTGTSNNAINVYTTGTQHVDVEDLDIYAGADASPLVIIAGGGAITLTLRRCVIRGLGLGTTAIVSNNNNNATSIINLDNCVIYGDGNCCVRAAYGVVNARYTVCHSNNATLASGFYANSGTTINCTNCYANGAGAGEAYNDTSGGTLNLTTSASSDTTGSTGLQSLAAADQFTALTAGSEDFRLKAGAALIDAGTTVSGLTTDIYGTSRPAGDEDIGAYEYAASGIVVPKFMAYYRQRRR